MTYRVINWSTGNVGIHALRLIIEHPEMELAGCFVHSEAKAGRDAGELAGIGPVGITATNDADALLTLDADAVCYTATGDLRPHEAVADMCRMLEAGKNVVSTSVVSLVHPGSADVGAVERLTEACRRGGTSCFTSGIDPGFANDFLPLALTGFCERVDSIRVSEILNYDTYDQATVLFDTMGFGRPLDEMPLLLLPGVLTTAWGPVVGVIAEGLGVAVNEVREVHERIPTDRDLTIPAGTVPAGTTGALRFEVQGIVGGEPRIVVEHVTRLADDLAPDWPQPTGHGSYRVFVSGSPTYKLELELLGDDGDHNTGGLIATAARVLNAIPAVCEAPPGLLSALDLPLVTGRGLMRAPGTK
jgi:hypothetical protein